MPANDSRATPRRAVVVAVVVALLVAAVLGWAGQGADPTVAVAPVSVDQIRLAPSTSSTDLDDPADATPIHPPTPHPGRPLPGTRQVEALDPLSGELLADDDPGEYRLGTVDLDFGPDAWVLTAPPMQDFDHDGRIERLEDELNALVGRQIRLQVRLDDGNDATVYVVNDVPYRDPAGRGPWVADGPTLDPVPVAQIRAVAVAAIGPGARLDELEAVRAGQVAWEASVTRADGTDVVVLMDAAGSVLTVRAD